MFQGEDGVTRPMLLDGHHHLGVVVGGIGDRTRESLIITSRRS